MSLSPWAASADRLRSNDRGSGADPFGSRSRSRSHSHCTCTCLAVRPQRRVRCVACGTRCAFLVAVREAGYIIYWLSLILASEAWGRVAPSAHVRATSLAVSVGPHSDNEGSTETLHLHLTFSSLRPGQTACPTPDVGSAERGGRENFSQEPDGFRVRPAQPALAARSPARSAPRSRGLVELLVRRRSLKVWSD